MTIWDWIAQQGPLATASAVIIILYALSKGILLIPWINLPGKRKTPVPDGKITFCDHHEKMYMVSSEIGRMPSEIVREQMGPVDDAIEEIHSILYSHYLTIAREKHGGEKVGLMADIESIAVDHIYWKVLEKARIKIRTFFTGNHFADLTEDAFNSKVDSRVLQINGYITKLLNEWYPKVGMKIAREELYDWNRQIEPKICKMIEDALRNGRTVALNYRDYRKLLLESVGVKE